MRSSVCFLSLLVLLAAASARAPSRQTSDLLLRGLASLPRTKALALARHFLGVSPRNEIDDAIVDLLEYLRTIIPEPVFISSYTINIDSSVISLVGTLTNMSAYGLSTYVVNGVNNDLDNLQANFSVSIPEIYLEGLYNLEGSVGGLIGLSGDGPGSLLVQGFETSGTVHLNTEDGTNNSPVSITALEINFSVTVFQTNFTNLNGGGLVGDLLNEIISDAAPAFIELYQEQLGEVISGLVIDLVNPYLSTCTLQELLDYLGYTGRSSPHRQPRADCIIYNLP